jgi:heterodisulfide reductase subunit D
MNEDINPLDQYRRWLYATDLHPSAGCVACGNCYGRGPANWLADEHNTADWKCVPFDYFGWRSYSPSGFWELATKFYHGQIDIDEEVAKRLFSCAQCGLCDEVCGIVSGENRLSEIFKVFRSLIYNKLGPYPGHKQVIANLKKTGNIYGRTDSTSLWAEGLDLPRIGSEKSGGVCLFVGHEAAYELKEVARAASQMLSLVMPRFGIFEHEPSSGYYAEMIGDFDLARHLTEALKKELKHNSVKELIVMGAQDYHVLKREFGTELKVFHITEVLARSISSIRHRLKPLKQVITYHDPCYLARHAGSKQPRGARIIDEPRVILSSIPEVKFKELPKNRRWTWCVGECGGIKEAFPEMATWRAIKLIKEATAIGAEKIVTASPPEQLHLLESTKDSVEKIQIQDVTQVLLSLV